ncbi:MAG: hypothetical protein ACYCVE_07065 [Gemmatimonadaceae bacterium]
MIAFATVISGACEAGHTPARQAGESAATASGGASAAVAGSARTSELPVANAFRTGCGAIAELLRSAAMAVGDGASAITPPRDTTDQLGNTPEEACVVAWRDSTAHGLPLRDVYARLEGSGWRRRDRLVDASGPGSEALAFSRGGAVCVVSGEEDVADDADSTYVPVPGFAITATCFRDRPDPS